MSRIIVILIAGLLSSVPSLGQTDPVAGSDSPEYREAVETWLAGDDMDALHSLAALAREGNTAAQMLLARIASHGYMHFHVTSDLPRKERVALLRIPKGLSGKSWLTEAANVAPLATALLQAQKIEEKVPAISALLDRGEPIAALLAAETILRQGQADALLEVLVGRDDKLPEEAVVIVQWALAQASRSASERYVGSARRPMETGDGAGIDALQFAWVSTPPRSLVENSELFRRVKNVAGDVRSWRPMVDFCERSCENEVQACVAVGISTMWASTPLAMRSPLETAISNETYWASPRAQQDMARQIPDVNDWNNWDAYQQLSPCYFDAMRSAQTEFGHAQTK
ncbi:hypothetical protein [Aliiroseovarius sp. S253]|uniref:hypothetical protein n=1 Tax=Aliiroseovarius sp. S253 TaxID=3415133 RepID=UPI003C79F08F